MPTSLNSTASRPYGRRVHSAREVDRPRATSSRRLVIVDEVRGLGIAGMVAYHFAWDLSFFGLIAVDVTRHPFWIAFARVVAGTFMIVVGISLVLAQQRGVDWSAFLRRFATIVGGAALVSGATYAVLPEHFVYFGILHSIALASLIALPFLVIPIPGVLAAASVVFVAPFLVRSEMLDGRLLAWTGLAVEPPASVDFVPILPWLGLTLIGVAVARLVLGTSFGQRLARIERGRYVSPILVWAGRNSLVIYLLHQPLLFGLIYLSMSITGL